MSNVISIVPVLPFPLIPTAIKTCAVRIIGQCATSSVYFSGWACAALSGK